MKKLNKKNICLLLTVIACTLASVTQLASINTLITKDREIFINIAILLTVVFSILYIFFKNNEENK
jgi:hypothetical protein